MFVKKRKSKKCYFTFLSLIFERKLGCRLLMTYSVEIMGYFNVKAILRTDKMRKDRTCPVYLKIAVSRKSIKIPVGIYGVIEEWQTTPGVFMEPGSSVRNTVLRNKLAAIEKFLWQQVASDNELSTDLVRFHFGKSKNIDFFALLDDCYQTQFRILAPSTKKHYLLVRRRLSEFQEHIGLHRVDQNFLLRFELFLRDRGIGDGGVSTHHKVLRVVLNYGLKRKIIKENPYTYFKVRRGIRHHTTLSEVQIKAIQELDIPPNDSKLANGLELTRDLFLFGCYTALRFSDIMTLNKKNLKGEYLVIRQLKTGLVVQVPLLHRSASIVKKYVAEDRDLIFPPISNQAANRCLKRIANMCAITCNVHFHLSRHSFGSLMAGTGMNPFSLSKLMGHSSIKTTMLYVNDTLENVRLQMGRSAIFD